MTLFGMSCWFCGGGPVAVACPRCERGQCEAHRGVHRCDACERAFASDDKFRLLAAWTFVAPWALFAPAVLPLRGSPVAALALYIVAALAVGIALSKRLPRLLFLGERCS